MNPEGWPMAYPLFYVRGFVAVKTAKKVPFLHEATLGVQAE